MKEIVKKIVEKNHTLVFVRYDDEVKLSMESEDPEVQKWLDTVKHKRIKEKDIRFVEKAFKKAFFSSNPIEYAQRQQKAHPSQQGVVQLNEWVQKRFGESPVWEVTVDATIPTDIVVDARVTLPNGTYYEGSGGSKKEAKADAADKALKDVNGGLFDWESDDEDD